MLTNVYYIKELQIESGQLTVKVSDDEGGHCARRKFKLVNGKLILISTVPQEKLSLAEVPLSNNADDLLLPAEPERYADMILRGAVIKTGLQAHTITKGIVQKALIGEKKRLAIDDPWSGCGTIQQIAFGDFTGDGLQ